MVLNTGKELKRIKYKLDPKELHYGCGYKCLVKSDQCDVKLRLLIMPGLCLMSVAVLNHL